MVDHTICTHQYVGWYWQIEGERGFAHGWPPGEKHQLASMETASYLVQGRFYGVDFTTTDVAVLLNSTTTLLSGSITERNFGVPFTFVKALNVGDKLDFSVGFGNGSNGGDSTGLQLIITQAGGPSTTATFSSPGDYILRLAASDSQLFSFNDTHVHVNAQCIPAVSGLVGWWRAEGDARDAVNGHDGELMNGASFAFGNCRPREDLLAVLRPRLPAKKSQ
jgi:hypothetical protein